MTSIPRETDIFVHMSRLLRSKGWFYQTIRMYMSLESPIISNLKTQLSVWPLVYDTNSTGGRRKLTTKPNSSEDNVS